MSKEIGWLADGGERYHGAAALVDDPVRRMIGAMPGIADRRTGVAIAVAVATTWGFLSIVFLAHPAYYQPVVFIDYLAVISFSVALATLAPAAWLIATVAGRTLALDRRTSIAVLGAATIIGGLTLLEGGLGIMLAAFLVVGAAAWRGPSVVVRVTASILLVAGPLAAVGNLIEDGFQLKEIGRALFLPGVGGVVVGLLGVTIALAVARRFVLAALPAATFVGVAGSIEYSAGLVILAAWLAFAWWIRRDQVDPDRPRGRPEVS